MTLDTLAFFVWLFLPLMIWLLNLAFHRPLQYSPLVTLALFVGYACYVTGAYFLDTRLEAEYYAFDLNGDGNVNGEELTPEAEEALHNLIADTGRATAPIFGLPITLVWAHICLFPLSKLEQWWWPTSDRDH